MDLQEVREKINKIDNSLNELFKERLLLSKQVAKVKLSTKDEVYKPERENEIYGKYSDGEADNYFKSVIRKIVQLSRKFQYGEFISQGVIDEDFFSFVNDKDVFEKGGDLVLSFGFGGENGLCLKDILQIATDTDLTFKSVSADDDTKKAEIRLFVSEDEVSRNEAFLLAYMLYKEV